MIIFLLLSTTLGILIYLDYCDKKLLKSIKNHYSTNVILKKNSGIYNKSFKKVGSTYNSITLELENTKINKTKDKYFKIKNSDYYVYYDNLIKSNKKNNEFTNQYLTFNKNVTGKNIKFYNNNKLSFKIKDNVSLPIEYMDDNFYYVVYFDKLVSVKRNSKVNIIDQKNNDFEESNNISIINYEVIDGCNEFKCVSVDNAKKTLERLSSEGFYSISLSEFNDWLNGNIRLKKNAVLLTTNTANDKINDLNNKSNLKIEVLSDNNIKFNDNNKTMKRELDHNSINRYSVKKTTSIENIVKMAKGEDVELDKEPVKITASSGGQGIAVLNYHFFYDPSLGESCNESICLDVKKFKQQLNYLRDNGYKTLKIEEFRKWIYGEIDLPQKSVLITVDDGAMGTGRHNGNKLIPILEEYNMNATLFLISGWWDINNYRSNNLDIQSHTNDMHQYGSCKKGQLVCASYDEALTDLKKSLSIIGNNTSFCYPFYSFNNTAIQAVKDAGFKIAFAGGNKKATRNSNKYTIPRYPIHKNKSIDQIKKIIS